MSFQFIPLLIEHFSEITGGGVSFEQSGGIVRGCSYGSKVNVFDMQHARNAGPSRE